MGKVVLVAVSKINYANDILYSYALPPELENEAQVGKRVLVPFGKSNQKKQAVILGINSAGEEDESLKSICAVLDEVPLLSCEMVQIIKWIKQSCFCTYYEALNLVLPKGIGGEIKKIEYILNSAENASLSADEKDFLSKISALNPLTLESVKSLGLKGYGKMLESLLSKKVLAEKIKVSKRAKVREPEFLVINPKIAGKEIKLTKKQKEVYDFLADGKVFSPKQICESVKVGKGVLSNLLKNEILVKAEKKPEIKHTSQHSKLSAEQEGVFKGMLGLCESGRASVSLLHGVTGSGKTHVILRLVDEVLKKGKGVIFLVPEIALTHQFIRLFSSRYDGKLAVIHSGIPDSKRVQVWEKVRSGEVSIVIGARSGIFAPFDNLGLIVVDEEHEFTYKSESSPRFDARKVAVFRSKFHGCMTVFSSATPSVESYFMAKNGKYHLFKLKKRYNNLSLPKTQIVDISGKFSGEGRLLFSDELIESLEENLKNGRQSIIFLNRRGYNTLLKCRSCGKVQMCPNCSVSLHYHKVGSKLLCHCCGFERSVFTKCESCGEEKLSYLGFGTQRAEDQLKDLFPRARVLRLDSDTKISSQQDAVKSFERGDYDILIGTQMVSKGFNFPNVTLVGVLMADQYLYSSDFRAYEKTFSLIAQTIGRAGRGSEGARAIIQTFSPENSVLSFAAKQDYEGFFSEEISLRKLMLLPPFADICLVVFKGKKKEQTAEASKVFFEKIVALSKEKYTDLPLRVFPPACADVEKIAGHYRHKIIIKCRNSVSFGSMINEALQGSSSWAGSKGVSIIVDINPSKMI